MDNGEAVPLLPPASRQSRLSRKWVMGAGMVMAVVLLAAVSRSSKHVHLPHGLEHSIHKLHKTAAHEVPSKWFAEGGFAIGDPKFGFIEDEAGLTEFAASYLSTKPKVFDAKVIDADSVAVAVHLHHKLPDLVENWVRVGREWKLDAVVTASGYLPNGAPPKMKHPTKNVTKFMHELDHTSKYGNPDNMTLYTSVTWTPNVALLTGPPILKSPQFISYEDMPTFLTSIFQGAAPKYYEPLAYTRTRPDGRTDAIVNVKVKGVLAETTYYCRCVPHPESPLGMLIDFEVVTLGLRAP
eukprot:Hpha_TRINITY_DN9123_c0_g1::TRINITY_DN9123_c0_g1_i1::g.94251::m.94251